MITLERQQAGALLKAIWTRAIWTSAVCASAGVIEMPPAAVSEQAPAGNAAALCYLERLQAETKTPGISGAVALGNRLVFSAGVGLIDVENRVPASGASVYNIGSVSKTITGIAIRQLLEDGRLTLDDDIRSHHAIFAGLKLDDA